MVFGVSSWCLCFCLHGDLAVRFSSLAGWWDFFCGALLDIYIHSLWHSVLHKIYRGDHFWAIGNIPKKNSCFTEVSFILSILHTLQAFILGYVCISVCMVVCTGKILQNFASVYGIWMLKICKIGQYCINKVFHRCWSEAWGNEYQFEGYKSN